MQDDDPVTPETPPSPSPSLPSPSPPSPSLPKPGPVSPAFSENAQVLRKNSQVNAPKVGNNG